ncbi:hypothetical protein [Microbacterium gilvum]
MAKTSGRRSSHGWRRRARAMLAAGTALVLASFGVLVAVPAQAATVGGITTAFAIDGNKAGPSDWNAFYGPGLTPDGDPTTGILDSYSLVEACEGDGSSLTDPTVSGTNSQNLNDDPWQMSPGPFPNKKSDLCSAGGAYEIVDVDGQQHVMLYQYWTRAPEGTGDLSINYSFAGGAAGRAGDILIQFNVNPNGSTNVIGMAWNGVSWVQTGSFAFQALLGPNPDIAGSIGDTFGEFAIDLTASGILPATGCVTFTSGDIVTKTGNAGTQGQLQDFMVAGDPLTIGTCGGLTVEKVVNGTAPADLLFDYVVDQADAMPVHGAAGATGPVADTDGSVSAITAQIAPDSSQTWTGVIAQPDYRVAEIVDALPPGVTGLSVVCTYQDPFVAGSPQVQTTVWQDGAYTGDDFVLSATTLGLMTPVCVITNQVTSLTLDKVVVNDDGGSATSEDFPLTATSGQTAAIDGVDTDSDEGSTLSALVAPGAYTIAEVGQPGYDAGSWSCVGGTLQGDVVTVAAGSGVVCSIVNDDAPAHLTLVKAVVNDDGGTAEDVDFTLTADGPTPLSGTEGAPEVTDVEVSAGSYAIGEVPLDGYALTGVSCWTDSTRTTIVPVTDGSIALANGASAFCELANDDLPGTLQLVKEVDNGDGGTADPAAWVLSADGPTPISGAGGTAVEEVSAGVYTLSESGGPAGYEPGAWSCSGASVDGDEVVVPNGGAIVCTIVNDDRPAHLTLVKDVVNDDGGTAVDTDFTLSATGPTPVSGAEGDPAITDAPVSTGVYTLGEEALPGYQLTGISCWTDDSRQTEVAVDDAQIELALGASAFCELTNDDVPAQLTLVKAVVNDDGGTAVDTDFTLRADGPTSISGTEGDAAITAAVVDAGVYTIGEDAVDGYDLTGLSCWTDADRTTAVPVQGGQITLSGAGTAYCELTNDDIPPRLTLVKQVVNDDGGTLGTDDFPLTADGPDLVTGASGDDAVTDVAVTAGSYTLSEQTQEGYAAGDWSCAGGVLSGDVLELAVGDTAECTIVNDDEPGELTLIKSVTNDDGGEVDPAAWTLTADGPVTVSGVTGDPEITDATVPAGAYTLTEDGPGGYQPGAWVCEGGSVTAEGVVTVPNGGDVTCTIVNDDVAPRLTLVKQVVNDDGGTSVATDWTLTASGGIEISGATGDPAVTDAAVFAGAYDLSESGPDGYAAGDWSCDGGALDGATLTLGIGESAVCTIVNDDIAPRLTLLKVVVNDDGGTRTVDDFPLTAEGPQTVTGVSGAAEVTDVAVAPGAYTLSEVEQPGYAAGAWSCAGGTQEGDQLTIDIGESAVCTIVNDDVAPTLTLVKTVVNDDGGAASAIDWTLEADGPTPVSGSTGSEEVTVVDVLAGTYVLSESGPSGYAAGVWSCDGGALEGDELVLGVGEDAVCTIVNDDVPAVLTLVKDVVNDDGGTAVDTDFTLTADGPTPVSGAEGDAAVTDAEVSAGAYALGEQSPTGYALVAVSCWTDESRETAVAVDGMQIALANGGSAYCELTNDDIAPLLTLVKQVVNDDGGDAVDTDWVLTADGPTPVSGVTDDPAVTGAVVTAGGYALSEAGPAGYAAGTWSCDGGSLDGADLLLAVGDVAVCTIVNDDLPGELTLVKDVVTDDGGTLDASAWTLTADGPVLISGATGDPAITDATVPAGDYALSEDGPSGYAPGVWVCDGGAVTADGVVTVPNGGDVTCTIVNDDIAPHLTLIKEVVNDDGGTALPTAWTLAADGPADIAGPTGDESVTAAAVLAGSYTLSETGPSGYAAGAWSCQGGALDDGMLVLEVGEDAICTIVNDDIAPLLTLVKQVVNDDGGDLGAADFPLTASGPDTISGVSGDEAITDAPVTAGAYDLSEQQRAGYAAGAWACDGGTLDGTALLLGVGDEAVCTIVNDDQPVDLALTKDDGGATAANGGSFDYTLAIENVGDRAVDLDEPVTVVDELPDGMVFVSGPDQCSAEGRVVTCDVDPALLGAGDAVEIVLTVAFQVDAPAGDYENIAWVTTQDDPAPEEPGCPSASNNVDCEPTPLQFPTLTLVKVVDNDEGGEAEVSDFVLSADGPVAISGTTGEGAVTGAEVPAGSYALSEDGPQGYAAGTWSCVGGALDGEVVTLAGIVDVVCTIVNADHPVDLALTKDDGGASAEAGQSFPYTITVANIGSRDVDADDPVTVTDVLPDGMVYVSGPEGCAADGQVVTCDVDPALLGAGESTQLVLTVMFEADALAGEYVNLAVVTTEDDPAPEEPTCPEPGAAAALAAGALAGNNVDCEPTPLVAGSLSAEKSVWEESDDGWVESDGIVEFGDTVRYQIRLEAAGDAPSRDVVVVDELQDGLVPAGKASCSAACVATLDEGTATHRVEIAAIEPGESVTIVFDAVVPDGPVLRPGERVEASFDNVAVFQTRNQGPAPTNEVTVTADDERDPAPTPKPTTPTPKPRPLAPTGGELGPLGLAVGGGLLLAGWMLVARARAAARTR